MKKVISIIASCLILVIPASSPASGLAEIGLATSDRSRRLDCVFSSQALAPAAGVFHRTAGAHNWTLAGKELRKVRVKTVEYRLTRLGRLVFAVALDLFASDLPKNARLKSYIDLPGMLRFAKWLGHAFPMSPWGDLGEIRLTDLYDILGAPEAVRDWSGQLGRIEKGLGWQPLPATYNVFKKAADELTRNPTLYYGADGKNRFLTHLREKLALAPEVAEAVSGVLSGFKGEAVLQALTGRTLPANATPLNWLGRDIEQTTRAFRLASGLSAMIGAGGLARLNGLMAAAREPKAERESA